MKIQFSPPDLSELEINELIDTVKSGWITTGPKTKQLEKNVAEMCRNEQAVCLNSQTACAEAVLRLLGIGAGDEVIVPAYTYTASASVVCHVGATVRFVDICKDSLEIDYDAVENAINEKTKAIIPVDLGGIPCDYDRLFSIAERKKRLFKPNGKLQTAFGRVVVSADAAHSFGATYKGKPIGNVADFTSFSFHAVKNFTTAEGGALTWRKVDGVDSEDIYHNVQLYSLHGQNKDALAKTKLGAWEYDIVAPLYKCNMTDIAASLGIAQYKRYPQMLKRRKEIIEKYDKAFRGIGIETLNHYTEKYEGSGHLYITRVPGITTEKRNEIIIKMAEAGIATNVHYKPLPMMTAYKNLGYDIKDFPVSYEKYENEITLPLHTCLTDAEVDYIITQYSKIVKEYIK